MKKIRRCRKCNDILPFTNSDFKNVDGLCYVCWTEREERKGKEQVK